MKPVCLILLFLFSNTVVPAQDSIVSRLILIGDAGKINQQQSTVINLASAQVLAGKTTVVFLGDNIYPKGIGLPGSDNEEATKNILRSQYTPLRSKGATVYFIPGNHDWDRMGKNGLGKIKAAWNFIETQNDSLLNLVPANGCSGPTAINLADSMVMIVIDSEWWLYPYDKKNEDADCDCNTKKEIVDKLLELFYENRYKVILLASHHPFQSYGPHGGYYSFKDHVFPLTVINKNLFIPLPVVGSLYPLLRTVFQNPEDLKHPLYRDMIKQVDEVFKNFPNLLHIAGHEHGLQFIKNNQVQLVSGSGAKNTFVKKGKHSLFTTRNSGFITADVYANNNIKFTYYVLQDGEMNESFTYLQTYTSVKKMEDSVYHSSALVNNLLVKAHEPYGHVSKLHKKIFGENYRMEWAAAAQLPVLKISEINGGLTPIQRGGGHQSQSLRLKDSSGKEWVLRSVNKYPAILLPEALRETFAKDIVTDAMSAQHPYSALVVPVLANAAGVPHANPVIGVVAPDKKLGLYNADFMNTVCLLEEREPIGKSDNSEKMYKTMLEDNDNSFDTVTFFKARLLDLFIGDWDRHEDQWRWAYDKNGKSKKYTAVPRDRDQVFHIIDGILPAMASRPWIVPMLHDFEGRIKQPNAFFTESNRLNKVFLNQLSYTQWMQLTNEFVNSMTDSVLEKALKQLPQQSYELRHDELLQKLKERRLQLAKAMEKYYYFINKIADITTSNKNEFVQFTDAPGNSLQVVIYKINKEGKVKDELFRRIFDPAVTKEIRLFLNNGNDSVAINNHSPIKLRIIGAKDKKSYYVAENTKKIQLYGREDNVTVTGNLSRVKQHLSNNKLNTAYTATNPYNKIIPLLNVGYNLDDGIFLGASVKFINQGFRKKPYGSMQQVSFAHSFSTNAYRSGYKAEWLQLLGNADVTIDAAIRAPNNTINFFGRGNQTVFDKTGDFLRFYRTRFSTYKLDPAIRFHGKKGAAISIGPSLFYYELESDDNKGRFISTPSGIGSYDSNTVDKNKLHLGFNLQYINDKRNSKIIPQTGTYVTIKLLGYIGMGTFAKDFAQIVPELCFYKKLNQKATVILAERLGGTIGIGQSAFYQSAFIGGHENLLGYRQFRFAGQHSFYNNLELRVKLADFASYILPGQFGLVGFWDAGKVWENNQHFGKWHTGAGGGFYFAPASMIAFNFVVGKSVEGWYPYFTMGFRF